MKVRAQGRSKAESKVLDTRSVSLSDVLSTPRGALPQVKRFRESHHMIARLVAMGVRPRDIAYRTGYTTQRVYNLSIDPSFRELVEQYRSDVDESWRQETNEYFDLAVRARVASARMIVDQLEDADEVGEAIPLRTLIPIHADFADRTGYGKRSTQVNINVDFAAQLERAIKRSEGATIEANEPRRLDPPRLVGEGTSDEPQESPLQLERRT